MMQVSVQKQAYERAKAEDNLEEAIHIKNVVLPPLRSAVQPDEVVESWHRPLTNASISSMHAAATQALGANDAAPFVKAFHQDLRVVASNDLEQAAAEQQKARASLQLLLEIPVKQQAHQLAQLLKLEHTIVEQMRLAVKALQAVPSGLDSMQREQAMHSPRVQDLIRQLGELRKLGCVLSSSREWHSSFFAASASAPLGNACSVPAADVRAELTQLLRKAASLANLEARDDEDDEVLPSLVPLTVTTIRRSSAARFKILHFCRN